MQFCHGFLELKCVATGSNVAQLGVQMGVLRGGNTHINAKACFVGSFNSKDISNVSWAISVLNQCLTAVLLAVWHTLDGILLQSPTNCIRRSASGHSMCGTSAYAPSNLAIDGTPTRFVAIDLGL